MNIKPLYKLIKNKQLCNSYYLILKTVPKTLKSSENRMYFQNKREIMLMRQGGEDILKFHHGSYNITLFHARIS